MNYKCEKCGFYWYSPNEQVKCPNCNSKKIKEK